MTIHRFIHRFIVISAIFLFTAPAAFSGDDALRMKPEELKEKLSLPDLHLVDVRIVSDWKKSDQKIVGAVRADPHDVSSWAEKIPKDSFVVVYCA